MSKYLTLHLQTPKNVKMVEGLKGNPESIGFSRLTA